MSTHKGQRGEQQACHYLLEHGYQIIARNVRIGPGEIDIIAERKQVLAFVEVKSHKQRSSSIQAVHRDKQRRLIRAASGWLARHQQYTAYTCRFDVMIIIPATGWHLLPKIEHMKDAFRHWVS